VQHCKQKWIQGCQDDRLSFSRWFLVRLVRAQACHVLESMSGVADVVPSDAFLLADAQSGNLVVHSCARPSTTRYSDLANA
jgi:hypothetical protein